MKYEPVKARGIDSTDFRPMTDFEIRGIKDYLEEHTRGIVYHDSLSFKDYYDTVYMELHTPGIYVENPDAELPRVTVPDDYKLSAFCLTEDTVLVAVYAHEDYHDEFIYFRLN